jgi:hypothetical protein
MSHWNLDAELVLTPQIQVHAPAEEIACVICSTSSRDNQPHTVCVVDVNPTSPTYSEVIGEIALEQRDERPGLHGAEEPTGPLSPTAGRAACEITVQPGLKIASKVLLAHDPAHPYGFSSAGFSVNDQSTAISIWYRDGGPAASRPWALRTIIDIPEEPECVEKLPALLQSSGAVPALITDFALSLDDRFLYVACWGTGHLKQFDVSDPLSPRETASVSLGGVATRSAHPSQARPLGGGPSSVSLSRDGCRLYLTNALSPSWEAQLYPDGFQGWMVKLDVDPGGGLTFDPNFFVDFGAQRPLQVRLQGQGLE